MNGKHTAQGEGNSKDKLAIAKTVHKIMQLLGVSSISGESDQIYNCHLLPFLSD